MIYVNQNTGYLIIKDGANNNKEDFKMVEIKRVVDGKEMVFILTENEIQEVRKQDTIEFAKAILQNYEEMITDYDDIIEDNNELHKFGELMEQKNLENNSDREIEAIEELFDVNEEY